LKEQYDKLQARFEDTKDEAVKAKIEAQVEELKEQYDAAETQKKDAQKAFNALAKEKVAYEEAKQAEADAASKEQEYKQIGEAIGQLENAIKDTGTRMENLKKGYEEEKNEEKKQQFVQQYQQLQKQLEDMNAYRTQLMEEYVKRTEEKDRVRKENEKKAFAAARDQANALNNEVENIKKRITRLQGKADAANAADKPALLQ
jgi:chromosome segregation ATPase